MNKLTLKPNAPALMVKASQYGPTAAYRDVSRLMRAMKFLSLLFSFSGEFDNRFNLGRPAWLLLSMDGGEVFLQNPAEQNLPAELGRQLDTDTNVIDLAQIRQKMGGVEVINNGVVTDQGESLSPLQLAQIFTACNEIEGVEFDGIKEVSLFNRFFPSQGEMIGGLNAQVTMATHSGAKVFADKFVFDDLPVVSTPMRASDILQVEFSEEVYPVLIRTTV